MNLKLTVVFLLIFFQFNYAFQNSNDDLEFVFNTIQKHYNNGYFKQAILFAKKHHLKKPKTHNDSILITKINKLLGDAEYELQNYFYANKNYNDAINTIPKTTEGQILKAQVFFDKSYAEDALGMPSKSYNTTKKAEQLYCNIKNLDANFLLDIYAKLSSDASYLGFYDEAEFYLKKGNRIINNTKLSLIDNNSASKKILFEYKFIYLYHLNGNEKELLLHINNLETLKKNSTFNDTEQLMYAASLNCVADYYLNNIDSLNTQLALKQAKWYLDKAIYNLDKEKYPSNYVQFLFNKIKLLRFSKKYNDALTQQQIMVAFADKNDFRVPFFIALKANIYTDMGNSKKALIELHKMAQSIHNGKDKLHNNFGNFKPSNTINHTGLLVEIADELIQKFPKDTTVLKETAKFYNIGLKQLKHSYEQELYSERIKTYYNIAIKGILRAKQLGYLTVSYKDILEHIENIENKLAWKAFLMNRHTTNLELPNDIFEKERFLRQQLVIARQDKDTLQITELKNLIAKNQNTLETNHPNVKKYVYSNFSLDVFQKKIKNQTCVIKYKFVNNTLYIFQITNKQIVVKSVNANDKLKNSIEAYIHTLKNKKEDKNLALSLCKTLIPFKVSNYKNITFIPDHVLYYLPFETLVTTKNNYLIEKHTISYASYLNFVYETETLKENFESVYVFSPSYVPLSNQATRSNREQLLGAENESKYISKHFKNKLYSGHLATKSNFINNSPKASIIHMALHAKINNTQPELSHFVFQNKDSISNKLFLEELYGLKLKANLAVLSACNTGLQISDNANGAISLQRAFTLSGVSSTVSSLWEVPDKATEDIMMTFYRYLKEGLSKSEALRLAKLNYLKTHQDANITKPYFWAGFVISGDDTPILKASTNFNLIIYIVSIAFCILIAIYLIKRFK